jgi:hypothetical protein
MRYRSSHYIVKKIEKLSDLLKHCALLKNHFVILSYHQSDVQKALSFKEKLLSFCIQDLDDLSLRHCIRLISQMNIRQVFFYKTELQEIVSLQIYNESQECSLYLLSKHWFQEKLWSMLRVSFWSAYLDRACCFHLTFLKASIRIIFSETAERK